MENVKLGMLDGFLTKSHQKSLKSLFRRSNSSKSNGGGGGGGDGGQDSPSSTVNSPKPIPQLSPFANSVVSRCSKCLPLFSSLLGFHFYTLMLKQLFPLHACYVIWVTLVVFHHPKSKNKHDCTYMGRLYRLSIQCCVSLAHFEFSNGTMVKMSNEIM